MNGLKCPCSHLSLLVTVLVLLGVSSASFALAQVPGVVPIIEIDKKIVTYVAGDQGLPEEIEVDDLGEVLVGTSIFFKYLVSYTDYITHTVPVTVTVPITDTFPVGVGIDLLRIVDDMGTLNPDDDFACVRITSALTDTQPVTVTLPITDTVVITSTTSLLPGGVFECVSSSGIFTDTVTGFTPKSGAGYLNTAVAVAGPCVEDCVSDDSDTASYVGLYWAFTPGFWKNHTGNRRGGGKNAWVYTAYDPNTFLENVFDLGVFEDADDLNGATLLDALRFKGGKGKEGAARILLRAGVAALLNASFHEEMNGPEVGADGELMLLDGRTLFPYSSQAIVDWIERLLASPDRKTTLLVAKELDDVNDGIHYIEWNWVP